MARIEHSTIASSAELELANVMRVDEDERGIVKQFFDMLRDKAWNHATHQDGTDIFKLPGERIHRIMGVTRTNASPEEVLTFFSDPRNFDEHFKILDDMFKGGSVVKIGGQGLELDATGPRGGLHQVGNFAALSIGGKDRVGPTDPSDIADGMVGLFAKARRSGPGMKLEAMLRSKTAGGRGVVEGTLSVLPSSQNDAAAATLAPAPRIEGQFLDRPGHALLHGTFKLPSIVPDRDFIWDQVALRLPTGSVLIAGKSVEKFGEDEEVPVAKGHVRGAVLTSGYYITPETESEGGGSKIAFVVQADPKGSLPAWVVNLVAPKQAHNVTRLRKYLDRE
jgi:hypothetical protein